jgi:hypothetical protein
MSRTVFAPNDEQRRLVKVLSSYGIRQEDIATEVGLRSPKTLRKHFREELDHGRIGADIRVAKTLYEMAISGRSLLATIFWLERRAGWRSNPPLAPRPTTLPRFVVASGRTADLLESTRSDGSLSISHEET